VKVKKSKLKTPKINYENEEEVQFDQETDQRIFKRKWVGSNYFRSKDVKRKEGRYRYHEEPMAGNFFLSFNRRDEWLKEQEPNWKE
jgi:hypothetical protein